MKFFTESFETSDKAKFKNFDILPEKILQIDITNDWSSSEKLVRYTRIHEGYISNELTGLPVLEKFKENGNFEIFLSELEHDSEYLHMRRILDVKSYCHAVRRYKNKTISHHVILVDNKVIIELTSKKSIEYHYTDNYSAKQIFCHMTSLPFYKILS